MPPIMCSKQTEDVLKGSYLCSRVSQAKIEMPIQYSVWREKQYVTK